MFCFYSKHFKDDRGPGGTLQYHHYPHMMWWWSQRSSLSRKGLNQLVLHADDDSRLFSRLTNLFNPTLFQDLVRLHIESKIDPEMDAYYPRQQPKSSRQRMTKLSEEYQQAYHRGVLEGRNHLHWLSSGQRNRDVMSIMKQYSNLPKELVTIIIIPYLHDSDDKSIELIASPSWTIPQFNNLPPATSMAFRMESKPPKQYYFQFDKMVGHYDYDGDYN
jgi:hypothetical protein